MADKKISQLTAATTPLAGTEVLPIVQSGSTVKVAVSDLTAGRAVAAAQLDVDNIRLDGSTISTTNTNGVLNVLPNGTGCVGIKNSVANTINTANAYGQLVVGNGTTDQGITIYTSSAAGGALMFADGTSGTATSEGYVIYDHSTSELAFGTDHATRGKWGATGNLHINNGNLVVGTAAKGIDFSANTHAAGMTSELLNWYEEGTWTPTDASGAGLTFAQASGSYTRIGRQVTAWGFVNYPGTASANGVEIGGLPFTSANVDAVRGGGMIGFCDASTVSSVLTNKNGTAVKLYDSSGVQIVNSTMNNKSIYYAVTYFV